MKKNLFKYFLLLICLLAAPAAHAQVAAGPFAPGTATDVAATGTIAWINPNNSKVQDRVFTTFTTLSGITVSKSHLLELTNFGFSIPVGATVNGIQADVVRKQSAAGTSCALSGASNSMCDNIVSLIDSTGTVTATNKASATAWSNTIGTTTYGGPADPWSLALGPSDINSSNFGIAIGARGEGIGGPSCVVAGTMVLTTHGNVPIQDLKIGEKIYSYSTTTKQMVVDTVTGVASEPISDDYDTLYYVYTSDKDMVQATASHMFFANGDFIAAPDLKVGDTMLNSVMHKVKITKIQMVKRPGLTVWNITVKKNANFFANNELVHNASTDIASLDYVQLTVTYTLPSSGFINGLFWFIQWLF